MKRLLQALGLSLMVGLPLGAADKDSGATTNTVTATFYISDVKCAACVSFLNDSMQTVPGVNMVDGLTETSGYARISFNPQKATHQGIAQAVAETIQIHGEPFKAFLKLRIPAYPQESNTAKVDALIAKQKDLVTFECRNREKGLFAIHFKPVTSPQPAGAASVWKPEQFLKAVKELGLEARLVEESPSNP